jgi:UDP-N-acetylglucosamine 2-epimerase (non-hydrolysing)/GDP/UDP-N,N'-diacetylbacillosamine 2-epimerase (hydrolysing)
MKNNINKKRKMRVVFVSERRADYSRFKPIMQLMKKDKFFDYKLIVTGISLLKEYGEDIKIIKKDGFKISSVISMYKKGSPDTGAEMTRAYGRVMAGLADSFEKLKPDLILSGFDIGANFSAAVVGAHMNIPVAHIQGGEVTGSIDESIRHAMSKFSHIHFPATKDAARRLMRMGEDRKFIFVVGCPSIDVLLQAKVIGRNQIANILKIDPKKPFALVVQHPVTTEASNSGEQIKKTLEAVKETGIQAVVLYPNNDAGTGKIIAGIHDSGIHFIRSLPPEIFSNTLRHCAVLIGNSSSGIHEASTFHIPVVNIGTRQQGRERPKNVIDAGYKKEEIKAAIEKALCDKTFKEIVKKVKNPYGDGRSAKRIMEVLKKLDIKKIPLQKKFAD